MASLTNSRLPTSMVFKKVRQLLSELSSPTGHGCLLSTGGSAWGSRQGSRRFGAAHLTVTT
jgi:hypothetical protein